MKTCIACGMPMQVKEDYPLGDESKDYCKFCAHEDGTMESYEEKVIGMTEFIIKTQGIDKLVAREAAIGMLKNLPAWK